MQINVLGTYYELFFVSENSMDDKDNLGECDRYTKDIRINQSYFEQSGVDKRAMIKTIRHEIIHAFFHEAGLDCYSEDEILVDALAILMPKMAMCIKEGEQYDLKGETYKEGEE